jgi:hypothetical protein
MYVIFVIYFCSYVLIIFKDSTQNKLNWIVYTLSSYIQCTSFNFTQQGVVWASRRNRKCVCEGEGGYFHSPQKYIHKAGEQHFKTEVFLAKFRKWFFSQKIILIGKLMVPSESAPQELSNEWSCQYVSKILKYFGQFLCPTLGSHYQSLTL